MAGEVIGMPECEKYCKDMEWCDLIQRGVCGDPEYFKIVIKEMGWYE